MLTQDINLIDMALAVQYQLRDPARFLFQVKQPEITLREVSESAIREVVGRSNLEAIFVSNRQQVTARTRELIQRTLDQYNTGITVTSVNLTDIQVPEAVVPSQRDANKALADKERAMKQAEAYASGILPVAEGAALRQLQEAEGYRAQVVAIAEGEASRFSALLAAYEAAPRVTRERLYIDAVENVLTRSRKVIVDTKGGNGQMLYLPLDKLIERNARARSATTRPRSRPAAAARFRADTARPRIRASEESADVPRFPLRRAAGIAADPGQHLRLHRQRERARDPHPVPRDHLRQVRARTALQDADRHGHQASSGASSRRASRVRLSSPTRTAG